MKFNGKGVIIDMSVYNGYLIKVKGIEDTAYAADFIIPLQYMILSSYKATYSTLDGDTKRDGEGYLVRTVLPHKVAHCSVDIRQMSNAEIWLLMDGIQSRYTDENENKVNASIWVPQLNDYVDAEFYVPDIEFTIRKIEPPKILYAQLTLEFIGY